MCEAILQYWHSPDPPSQVRAAFASFAARNPGVEHRIFDEEGAAAFIAERFGGRELAAFRACGVPAMQADYFRYCAVYALGGVYADADFECIAGLDGLLAGGREGIVFGRPPDRITEVFEWPRPVGRYGAVSNDLFAFAAPGHPLLGAAIELATANVERRLADGPKGIWLTTGPGVFTTLYLMRELGSADAFVRYATGSILTPTATFSCEVIGDLPRRVPPMFDGVDILPRSERRAWVKAIELPRPDSGREVYWPELTGTIFR